MCIILFADNNEPAPPWFLVVCESMGSLYVMLNFILKALRLLARDDGVYFILRKDGPGLLKSAPSKLFDFLIQDNEL